MKFELKLYLFILFFCFNTIYAQTYLHLNGEIGSFISHSDNSYEITKEKNLSTTYGLDIGFEIGLSSKGSFLTELGYFSTPEINEFNLNITDIEGNSVNEIPIKFRQISIPIDVSYNFLLNRNIQYGLGFSMVNNLREISFVYPLQASDPQNFGNKKIEDRLSSFGLGFNSFIRIRYLISASRQLYILTALKIRYLNSFWYDKKGRNLENFEQHFFQGIFSFGIQMTI